MKINEAVHVEGYGYKPFTIRAFNVEEQVAMVRDADGKLYEFDMCVLEVAKGDIVAVSYAQSKGWSKQYHYMLHGNHQIEVGDLIDVKSIGESNPLKMVKVCQIWTPQSSGYHYAATKATRHLEGVVYGKKG